MTSSKGKSGQEEKAAPFELNGTRVMPGTRAKVELPLAQLYTQTPLNVPIHVIHGRRPGPVLLVSAAIHGDELNGVEIIRRLLRHSSLNRLNGTLLAVPVVNVFGFMHKTRYLPDRRDLNRSFPGSETGSLGARMAWQVQDPGTGPRHPRGGPAHRRHPSRQPAADPRRPVQRRHRRHGRRVRRAGGDQLGARRGHPAGSGRGPGHSGDHLRSRRSAALRRKLDSRRR